MLTHFVVVGSAVGEVRMLRDVLVVRLVLLLLVLLVVLLVV